MKFLYSASVLLSSLWMIAQASHPAAAQGCNYFAGTAVDGQSVNVDLCSITPASPQNVDFVYYLGNLRVPSQAHCDQGSWTSFVPQRQLNRPQSEATQRMLETVCAQSRVVSPGSNPTSEAGVAIVFDPPSNVRLTPNGEILCSVRERVTINIFGVDQGWYYTDICGSMGRIHESQLRF